LNRGEIRCYTFRPPWDAYIPTKPVGTNVPPVDPQQKCEFSAPPGLHVSSRGQRPRNRRPLTPFPLSPLAGRGVPKAGCGVLVGGFHPRLLNLLPSGEHGFMHSRPYPVQWGTGAR